MLAASGEGRAGCHIRQQCCVGWMAPELAGVLSGGGVAVVRWQLGVQTSCIQTLSELSLLVGWLLGYVVCLLGFLGGQRVGTALLCC